MPQQKKLMLVAGARPNFMKIAPVIRAIQARPDDPTLFIARARVQIYAGQYADAQTSAEDALLLNPNNSMAHVMRAWALDFQGEYLAAESAIKRAAALCKSISTIAARPPNRMRVRSGDRRK